jgi:hypothetical protein
MFFLFIIIPQKYTIYSNKKVDAEPCIFLNVKQ